MGIFIIKMTTRKFDYDLIIQYELFIIDLTELKNA